MDELNQEFTTAMHKNEARIEETAVVLHKRKVQVCILFSPAFAYNFAFFHLC
jgi:hypothetical protein